MSTCVGSVPGTPMGTLLRRFWMPALLSTELPEPDCAPIRVRLLGEDLVAFRDTTGQVGLCRQQLPAPRRVAVLRPQRGSRPALRLSRLEVRRHRRVRRHAQRAGRIGLQTQGHARRRTRREEAGGVIWVYMGPARQTPSCPDRSGRSCRRSSASSAATSRRTTGSRGWRAASTPAMCRFCTARLPRTTATTALQYQSLRSRQAPEFRVVETDFGLMIGARRRVSDTEDYWRVTPFSLPFYTVIPPIPAARATTPATAGCRSTTSICRWSPTRGTRRSR